MKKYYFLYLSISLGFSSLAQTDVLYGVWVLNEGVQDWTTGEMVVPASVGVYDVETAVFTEVMQFDSANFTTDIVIDGGFAYVGADDRIVKIDLESHEVVAEAWVQGVRYLDVYNGKVFMTRGDVDPVTWGRLYSILISFGLMQRLLSKWGNCRLKRGLVILAKASK